MAFESFVRVRVTDETSQYRGCYGTVASSEDDYTDVRIDGFGPTSTVSLPTKSLQESTQPCPLDYPPLPGEGGDS